MPIMRCPKCLTMTTVDDDGMMGVVVDRKQLPSTVERVEVIAVNGKRRFEEIENVAYEETVERVPVECPGVTVDGEQVEPFCEGTPLTPPPRAELDAYCKPEVLWPDGLDAPGGPVVMRIGEPERVRKVADRLGIDPADLSAAIAASDE